MNTVARGFALLFCAFLLFASQVLAQRQMENLGRGLVAVRSSNSQAYISWRLLGTDPSGVAFNVYRSANGGTPTKLNSAPLTATTDCVDAPNFAQSNAYTVRAVINGVEQAPSAAFTLPTSAPIQQYLNVPLQIPAGGTTPDGVAYTYEANDCSIGDLDGDGEYEIVLKWNPTNAKDNSQSGYTGNVFLDAYKLDGTRLWRIDLGRNIRAGAHYTQVMVYDLDGNGKAEVACKTAPGTVDGQGKNVLLGSDSASADYRNSSGYILSGPEYLTIFNGLTGAELATTTFVPTRGTVSNWGDSYGNRVDRFLAGIAYLDGQRPSLIMCRGYYTRAAITAWDWRNGQLTKRWAFDTGDSTTGPLSGYRGQGSHSLTIGDVDGDGKDEITYGACAIDDNGTGLYTTKLGHGDALHMSDMDPDRPGQEVWMVHEEPNSYGPNGLECRDAKTGALIFSLDGQGVDVGRGVAIDIDPRYPGVEMWGSRGGLMSASGVQILASHPSQINFAVWWDGDLLREILDNTTIYKWNWNTSSSSSILAPTGLSSNNSTKSTPCLSADFFGDWREEVIWRTSDNTALRIYTTTIPATNRLTTLMHDPQYRVAIAWQTTAYNQPPHPSFYIGPDMSTPPRAPIWAGDLTWSGTSSTVWDSGASASWLKSGSASTFTAGQTVLFSISGTNSPAVTLTGQLSPGAVVVHNPKGKDYTFGGSGSLTGTMTLTKAGEGTLTLSGSSHSFSGATSIQQGAIVVNSQLASSAVTVEGYGQISGSGTLGQTLTVKRRGHISPGAGAGSAGTLTVAGPVSIDNAIIELDLSNTPGGANDRIVAKSNLTLTGTTQIKINQTNGALTSGTYALIAYSGAFSGTLANLPVTGITGGATSTLINTGSSIALAVQEVRVPRSFTWRGSGAVWDTTTMNWLLSGTAAAFVNDEAALFDATGSASPVVNIVGQISPASVTASGSASYTLSGTGAITGSGGLTKSGAGKLTVQTSNTFTGPVALNGGTIEVAAIANGGAASPLGAATSAAANLVFSSGTLRFTGTASASADRSATLNAGGGTLDLGAGALTLSGTLTGAGSLTKSGAGALTLNSASDYSGGTFITGGTVTIGNSASLGTGSVTLSNAALEMGALAPANALIISGSSSVTGGSSGGAQALNQVTGGGTAVLVAHATNVFDFEGSLTGFAGTLVLDNAGGSFRIFGSTGSDATTFDLGNATLTKRSSTASIALGALTGGASAVLSGASGSGNTTTTTYVIGAKNLSTTFAGKITDGAGPVLITKVGSGTLTLTGSHSYTGATTVSAGVLRLSGVLSSSGVTVLSGGTLNVSNSLSVGKVQINAGGTLTGSGSVSASFDNAGTVAITSGTLTLSGASLINSGTMRFLGGASLQTSGTLINNGLIDIISGGDLPAIIVNNGVIVDASSVAVQQIQISGSDARIFIQSYTGHDYQLQRRDSLTSGAWQNLGAAQPGTGGVLLLIHSNSLTGTSGFYRVLVAP